MKWRKRPRRCRRLPARGDTWGYLAGEWHALFCAECRRDRALNRGLARAVRRARALGRRPPPPGLRARIMESVGLPVAPATPPRRSLWRLPPLLLLRMWLRLGFLFRLRRRDFALGIALLAALALFLLPAGDTGAQGLHRTLAAMARVRSAHVVGRFTSYEGAACLPFVPERRTMEVEWWYRAPDKFRRVMGPEVPDWGFPPSRLTVNGAESSFINLRDSTAGWRRPRERYLPELSPVDFFSRKGLIDRALREQYARVRRSVYQDEGRIREVYTVEYRQPDGRRTLRERWVLHVDPGSDRLVKVEWSKDRSPGLHIWLREAAETLDRFEYDLSVSDDYFRIESPETKAPHRRRFW